MQTVTDVLLALFLALGSAWFAVDLARKLRRPCPDNAAPGRGQPETAFVPAAAPVAAPTPAEIPATSAPVPAQAAPSAVPAAHLVAITAAVHHVFKGRARLLSAIATGAAPAAGPAPAPVDWAREGRRDIFTSHRVR